MMQFCCLHPMLALCTFFLTTTIAQASYGHIVGYDPLSDVEQHSFIDLDQQEMEAHLKGNPPDFIAARNIYTTGGNSGGYAQFTILPLSVYVARGAAVIQTGNAGATGYMKSSAMAGSTTVKVTYRYTSKCKMGGSSSPDTSGCFTVSGALSVSGVDIGSPSSVTNRYRTLAGFSTQAESKMAGQEFYAAYRAYYNEGDYANRFVMAALNGEGIFSGKDAVSRVEGAKKGSAYQNVWMYVIREMEDAIMDCTIGCLNCNDDPVHAWDEAVAFYAGSLEGLAGDSSGKLLYRLAEKRCANFGTCSSGVGSRSIVNTQIVAQFSLGKYALNQGQCVEVIPIKRRIVELMSVPLVQGALRYAYKIDQMMGGSKEKAEGAAFAAAILPRVAQCNRSAAMLISHNMAMDVLPMKSRFASVKEAFESTYACMGITCSDVGGLIISGNTYYPMAEPCTFSVVDDALIMKVRLVLSKPPAWTIVVLVIATLSLLGTGMMALTFWKQGNKYKQQLDEGRDKVSPFYPEHNVIIIGQKVENAK